jgi:hypothetical protein
MTLPSFFHKLQQACCQEKMEELWTLLRFGKQKLQNIDSPKSDRYIDLTIVI